MKNNYLFLLSLFSIFVSFNTHAQTNTNSLLFNGESDYVNVDSNDLYNMGDNSFSYQFYFKINDGSDITTTHYQMLLAKGASMEISDYGYFMDIRKNGGFNRAHVIVGSNSIKASALSSTIIQDDVWYNFAMVVNRQTDELKLYIDGLLEQSVSISDIGSLDNEWPVQIGRYKWEGSGNTDHFLNGHIDEITTWNYALSDEEILQFMLCPPVGTESGLLAFWNMEEGTGVTTMDQSTNANTGILIGANWSMDTAPYFCCTPNLITTQPEDLTIQEGNDAHFSIITSGSNISYQWQADSGFGFTNLTNAGQFSGTNSNTLTVSTTSLMQNNWFFRCISNENQFCADTSDVAILTVNTLSTTNIGASSFVKIYPNPSSNLIVLDFDKIFNGEILISDPSGKILMKQAYHSDKILLDAKSLRTNGAFILTLIDFDTNKISYHRIIHQK
ncbi:MAG: LamG domain-containing protein [Bacteroidetes bacterium]|nr:MAG: LamG domain-containing protein [Bacteroidota bacterium]